MVDISEALSQIAYVRACPISTSERASALNALLNGSPRGPISDWSSCKSIWSRG
jgi:hypothetical protein